MTPPKNKATFIVRFWTEADPVTEADWRGTAERVGTARQCQFKELRELTDWIRRELSQNQPMHPPS